MLSHKRLKMQVDNVRVSGFLREKDLVSLTSRKLYPKPLLIIEDMCHVVYMRTSSEEFITYISDYGDGSLFLASNSVHGHDFVISNLYINSDFTCPYCHNGGVNFTYLRDFECTNCAIRGNICFNGIDEVALMFKDISLFKLNPRWRWAGNVK